MATIRWHHGFLEPQDGHAEIEATREAVKACVERVMPMLRVDAERLGFVPLGDGRTQVNVPGFGPFGVIERGGVA